jgi:hypothetical protein
MTDDRSAPAPSPFATRTIAALVLAALALNLWWVTRAWNESLRDGHEFRQFQTAITAYYFQQDGVKLAYETPVLGAPWSIPMEFPTYQTVVAALSRATGWPLEQTGRAVGILFFYAALPAVFLLLRQWRIPRALAWCAVAAVLTTPIYAFYARTFLIETTALCFALWFLWGFHHGLAGHRLVGGAVALLAGMLAALTKVTTFGVVAVPALIAGLLALRDAFREKSARADALRLLLWCAGIALAIGAVAVAWVRYSDAVKAANPYAGFLTSGGLKEWNLGTPGQRFTAEFWHGIYAITSRNILSEPALLLLCSGLVLLLPAWRRVVLGCVAVGCSGFLIFSNLYFIHDYYHCASAVFLVAGFGIVAGAVLVEERLPRTMRLLLVGGTLLVAQTAAFLRTYGGFYERPNPRPMAFAEIVERTTDRNDVVAAFGLDWNAELPYYSRRRAIMVPHNRIDDTAAFAQSLAALGSRRVGALVLAGTLKTSPYFIRPRVQQLGLEPFPIAETDTMALYLRRDLHERARGILQGNHYPGVALFLESHAAPPQLEKEHDLETPEWRAKLAPLGPTAPYLYRSIYPLGVNELNGQPILGTHAPTELCFRAPPGARHIAARGGLVPAAYTDGHITDGVVLQVIEELPSGARQILFERALRPVEIIADREEVAIQLDLDRPLTGNVLLRVDPGPAGNVNFDWAYWHSVRIY